MTDYLAIQERDKKFTEWRKRTAQNLPALCERVFALRGTGYVGCGFHWCVERDLGTVMALVNNYDNGDFYNNTWEAEIKQTVLRIRVEHLYKSVTDAEKSVTVR